MTLVEALIEYMTESQKQPQVLYTSNTPELMVHRYTGRIKKLLNGVLVDAEDVDDTPIFLQENGMLYLPTLRDFLSNDWNVEPSYCVSIIEVDGEEQIKPTLLCESSISIRG